MDDLKSYLLLLGIIFVGFLFVSGINHSYGYSFNEENGFVAGLTQLAQTFDSVISSGSVGPDISSTPSKSTEPVGSGSKINPESFANDESQDEFIDPREIKNTLREIKDMKRQLKMFLNSVKLTNSESTKSEIDSLLNKTTEFETTIRNAEKSGSGVREAIEEFRQAEIWEEINKLRARVELPRELKMAERELKRLDKITNQKSFQKLGLDMESLKSWIAESNIIIQKLKTLVDAGNWENVNSEMEDWHERPNPGEVSSVLYRVRDLYNRMKMIKDEEVKSAIEESLKEVKDDFNQGDYRSAREILDDIHGELEELVMKAAKIGRRGGITEEEFDANLGRIKDIIERKLGEKERNNETLQKEPQKIELPSSSAAPVF